MGAQAHRIKTSNIKNADHDRYLQQINELKFRMDKNRNGKVVVERASTRGLTYASLSRRSKVDEIRLRLVNGMFPKEQPDQGRLVKIIQ